LQTGRHGDFPLLLGIIWFLSRYNWSFQYVGMSHFGSFEIAHVGKASWRASERDRLAFHPRLRGQLLLGSATVSALQGLVAKEQVVSSMTVLSGKSVGEMITANDSVFHFFATNSWAAYSFIAFNLFSAPCFGALAAMRKELGSARKMFAAIGFELLWAYALSTLIGLVGWGINGWGAVGGL
jgi:ferrous iron transport protein B